MALVDWDQVYKLAGINTINAEIAKLDSKIKYQLRMEKQKTTELREIKGSHSDRLLLDDEGG